MKTRSELNQETYQQAVKSAEHLTPEAKAEYLAETEARYRFEQQAEAGLQTSILKRPLVKSVLSTVLILIIGAVIYEQSGRFELAQKGIDAHQAFKQQVQETESAERNDRYIHALQQQLRQNPNNGDLWFELGQAYALNNDFEAALICYQNAQKVLGDRPAVLGAMATAAYYENKQKMNPQAEQWIKQALAQDPKENASLLLLASDAFLNNQFQQAIDYWRTVLDNNNESINRRAIIESIRVAEQRLANQNNVQ